MCGIPWWRENEDEAKTDGARDMTKVAANAHYKCQKCGGEIQDFERPLMLENGIWRPGNPRRLPAHFGGRMLPRDKKPLGNEGIAAFKGIQGGQCGSGG